MTSDPNEKLASGFAKIGLVLRHHAWEAGEQAGLTPTQSQILAVLRAREPSGLSVSALSAELAVTQPTVSDAIAALVRKALVKKSKSGEDARVVLVRLTSKGRRSANDAAEWPDFLLRAVGTLDDSERAVFVRGLVKMIHSLQQSGQIPLARMCTSCVHFRPHAHAGTPNPHHCAYVDAPLGDTDLRLDCREHTGVDPELRPRLWQLFVGGRPLDGVFPPRPRLAH